MGDQIKILIIDDEDLVRDAISMVLERIGYNTTPLGSVLEALEIIEHDEFDVILTDIVMPDMDGVAFIKELRKRNNQTPVITITGGARVGQKNMSIQAQNAGAVKTLRKPVNKHEITEAIKFALD